MAVLEKGWLGGGNTGRNTTIIRSNYLYDESAGLYNHALNLWDGLSQDLNYNVMYSPRGVMMLAHNVHDVQVFKRHVHANRLNGVQNEWLSPQAAKEYCPPLNISQSARYPVMGAALQRKGGTARHALVSEPVKPCFPCVVMSNTVHAYISQSDKGELVIGAGTDQYTSYSQTGGMHILSHTLDAICEMFPIFTRMKMLRSWGGIVDTTPDRSPILSKTPVPGLYVNCGWGTGGFKATPGSGNVFAHTIARDEPHPIIAPFILDRFVTGRLIDEAAAAAVAH